ncbi:hypothetical protein ABXX32_RS25560, partial [Escherichia coli]
LSPHGRWSGAMVEETGFVATDNHYHFRGSFPAIRAVTGRRPRAFSLFMRFFEGGGLLFNCLLYLIDK